MNPLIQFQQDEHTRDAVREFFIQQLGEMAIARVFEREDVSGIADAKETIDKAFSKLQDLYEPKKKPLIDSSR